MNVSIDGVEYAPVIKEVFEKKWAPKNDKEFFYVDESGEVSFFESKPWNIHNYISYGNCYETSLEAYKARDKQRLLVVLKDFADRRNARCKYEKTEDADGYFSFTHNEKHGWTWVFSSYKLFGIIQFIRKLDCVEALKHFGSRLDSLL